MPTPTQASDLLPGPMAVPPATGQATVEQLQTAFDNSIWYLLSLWHPLQVAVTNAWGGPDSSDKRDWFAGAISDLFTSCPDTDQEELEVFLLQIMQDEFDCNVEDESENEVAGNILKVRQRMMETRTLEAAHEIERRWKNRGQMKTDKVLVQEVNQDAEDGEWEGFPDEDDDMEDAPPLVAAPREPKEKPVPEVDDDGFTKVVGKKRN